MVNPRLKDPTPMTVVKLLILSTRGPPSSPRQMLAEEILVEVAQMA